MSDKMQELNQEQIELQKKQLFAQRVTAGAAVASSAALVIQAASVENMRVHMEAADARTAEHQQLLARQQQEMLENQRITNFRTTILTTLPLLKEDERLQYLTEQLLPRIIEPIGIGENLSSLSLLKIIESSGLVNYSECYKDISGDFFEKARQLITEIANLQSSCKQMAALQDSYRKTKAEYEIEINKEVKVNSIFSSFFKQTTEKKLENKKKEKELRLEQFRGQLAKIESDLTTRNQLRTKLINLTEIINNHGAQWDKIKSNYIKTYLATEAAKDFLGEESKRQMLSLLTAPWHKAVISEQSFLPPSARLPFFEHWLPVLAKKDEVIFGFLITLVDFFQKDYEKILHKLIEPDFANSRIVLNQEALSEPFLDIFQECERGHLLCHSPLLNIKDGDFFDVMYDDGQGEPKDDVKAMDWYRKAAEEGYPKAQFILGVHLYESSQQDYVEAVKWFRKAAEQGHALAQNNLGCCYDNGYGVSKDYLVAAKWYRKAAYQNLAPSQYSISHLYLRGLGVPQDFVEAYKWTKLAALQQHSDSIEQLDSMNVLITSAQKTEALQFVETFCGDQKKQDPSDPLRSAAASTTTKPTTTTSIATHALLSDKPPAEPPVRSVSWKHICIAVLFIMIVVGLIENGCEKRKIESDISKELNKFVDVKSVSVTSQSLKPVNPKALSNIPKSIQAYIAPEHCADFEAKLKNRTEITGSCTYFINEQKELIIEIVNIDGDSAEYMGASNSKYRSKTDQASDAAEVFNDQLNQANQGNAKAQAFIGDQYYYGVSVAKDLVKAVEWYTKAASQGNADGECGLGDAYYNGVGGLSKDPVKAVDWYRKAADQGNADAQHSLGGAYVLGVGIAKDPVEGIKWIRKAADQGSPAAQCDLGNAYYDGIGGLIKDPVEAAKWWKKATDQGYPPKGN